MGAGRGGVCCGWFSWSWAEWYIRLALLLYLGELEGGGAKCMGDTSPLLVYGYWYLLAGAWPWPAGSLAKKSENIIFVSFVDPLPPPGDDGVAVFSFLVPPSSLLDRADNLGIWNFVSNDFMKPSMTWDVEVGNPSIFIISFEGKNCDLDSLDLFGSLLPDDDCCFSEDEPSEPLELDFWKRSFDDVEELLAVPLLGALDCDFLLAGPLLTPGFRPVCDDLGDELPLGDDDAENEEDLGKLLLPPSLARIVLLMVIFMPSELCLTMYSEFLLLPLPGFALLLLVKTFGWPPRLVLKFSALLPDNVGVGDELCEL
jgi:hypothetical protein